MPEATIELNNRINGGIYDIMAQEPDPAAGAARIAEHVRSMLVETGATEEIITRVVSNVTAELGPAGYPWMRYFILSDPSELLPQIRVPLLALNGEKDCQVLAGPNLDAIEAILSESGHPNYRVISLPDLNHLFQHSATGLVNEYVEIEETISPEVREIIAEWILGICHPDCVSRSLGEG